MIKNAYLTEFSETFSFLGEEDSHMDLISDLGVSTNLVSVNVHLWEVDLLSLELVLKPVLNFVRALILLLIDIDNKDIVSKVDEEGLKSIRLGSSEFSEHDNSVLSKDILESTVDVVLVNIKLTWGNLSWDSFNLDGLSGGEEGNCGEN